MDRAVKRNQPQVKSPTAVARTDGVAARYDFDGLEERFDLPDGMLRAVCLIESEGKPWAQSGDHCVGLMQLAVGTAREVGVCPRGLSEAEAKKYLKENPGKNVLGGARYLHNVARDLHRFNERLQANGGGLSYDILDTNGDITEKGTAVVLAAYNHGPGNMRKQLRGGKGDPDNWYARMPTETHNYVLDVMSYMGLQPPVRAIGAVPRAPETPAQETVRMSGVWQEAREIAAGIDARLDGEAAVEAEDAALRADKSISIAIQEKLNAAGYRDAEGRKLVEDGRFGKRSMEAYAKFEADNAQPKNDSVIKDDHLSAEEIGVLVAPSITKGAAKPVKAPVASK